jgi:hypothetical protein
MGLPFTESGKITVFGLQLPLPEDTTFVASVGYGVSALHLRIEELAANEADAGRSTEDLGSLLRVFQAMQPALAGHSHSPDDVAMRQMVESIKIEQHKDRAVLTASVPLELAKRLAAPPPAVAP